MVTESTLASWAVSYAACGFRLFPLRPGGKTPLRSGWQRSATGDSSRLRAAFLDETRNLGALAGVGFDVFDIEVDHLDAVLAHVGGAWPAAPRSRTGRGGVHLFVRPVGLGNRRLELHGRRVGDLKGRGGFVVLPPSTTEAQYGWEVAPSGLVAGVAPARLLDLVVEHAAPFTDSASDAPPSARHAGRILAGLVDRLARASEGERNDVLFWAACRIAEHGLPASVAQPALEEAALAVGLAPREVRATLRSAAHR